MEPYTNSHPNLINELTLRKFNSMFDELEQKNKSIWNKIYDTIIYPYLGVFIILLIIGILIIIQYFKTRTSKKQGQQQSPKEPFDEIPEYVGGLRNFDGMNNPNERIARPTFNPSIPISEQESYVNYLPDEVPIIKNGRLVDNVKQMPYNAPKYHPNTYQYLGPYYRVPNKSDLSDDMFSGFIDLGQKNLDDYDEILGNKISVDPTKSYQYNE